jgi:hypothetical protein
VVYLHLRRLRRFQSSYQSASGALAATAYPGEKIGDIGTNLMIAGITWQVVGMSSSSSFCTLVLTMLTWVVLGIFGALVVGYSMKTYRRRNRLSVSALQL